MKSLRVTITGISPLLMHSDRFANPLDSMTKAHKLLTSKRTKTDEDHIAIARSEFIGSCYWRADTGFYIPGQNLDASLRDGAKLQKLGKKFTQAVQVLEDRLVLKESLPKTPQELWELDDHRDVRGVKVSTSKLMRYRPVFNQWSVDATIVINDRVLEERDVLKALDDAGQLVGIGDYRPRFGKFKAKVN